MTLPPVRALGKTREGGKKKKTPMDGGRCGGEIMWMLRVCVRDSEREKEKERPRKREEEEREKKV